jgi:anti-sigma B factor antagonist
MNDCLTEPDHFARSRHQHRFEVHEIWNDRIVILSVRDAVDMLSAPELTEAICDALDKAPAGLIIDLTDVNFLASIGMSVLMAAQEAADALSVRLGIVAHGAATSRPIMLLGIDAILTLYPTLDDGLRDLRRPPALA